MIRKSFLQTLDKKLKKFDNREREEAILFYSELFDEMNLADEDQIPNQYDVNKIARELNVSMKIDNWEDENSSIKKIFKGIPIITLSILSLPTILVGLIVFLALLFTAIFFNSCYLFHGNLIGYWNSKKFLFRWILDSKFMFATGSNTFSYFSNRDID